MSADEPGKLKRKKGNEDMSAKEKFTALVMEGAALTKEKKTVMTWLGSKAGRAYSALNTTTKTGKGYFHKLPEGLEGRGLSITRGNNKVNLIEFMGERFEDSAIIGLATAWNFKADGARLAFMRETGGSILFKDSDSEEENTKMKVKGEETEVKGFTAYFDNTFHKHSAPEKVILEFLSLGCVTVDHFSSVGQEVDRAYKSELALDVNSFDDSEKLALIFADTTAGEAKRALAEVLLGCTYINSTLEEKIDIFGRYPTVNLAATLGLNQTCEARLQNVRSSEEVKTVFLKDLKDGDLVVMSKVNINQNFWDKLTDYSSVAVYKSQPSLAVIRKTKKGGSTHEQAFPTMKAELVSKIVKAIVAANEASNKPVAKPAANLNIDSTYFQ
jgi:hypothetical protein